MKDLVKEIERLIQQQKTTEALNKLNAVIAENVQNIELLRIRGDLFYGQQKYSQALNDYNKVLKVDKNQTLIKSKVEMIKGILKFEALDIFESTNLNNDPWLD
ncbi:MAG: hypothetical protein MI739_13075 [Bacteroidales bacterium]|nr:hypothetical protein [Bacteroidales bacterium]